MKKPLPVFFQPPEQTAFPFPMLGKSFEQEPSAKILAKWYDLLRIKYY